MRNFAERDLVENNITDKADATGLLEITSIYPVTQCNNFAKIFMFISQTFKVKFLSRQLEMICGVLLNDLMITIICLHLHFHV